MIEHKAMQVSFPRQSERFSNSACLGFATLSRSLSHFFDKNKVVPRSSVSPDHFESFNCKGLFTTTHATKHRSQVKSVEKAGQEQLVADVHSSIKVDKWNRLPDRNSEPGSIGIGQVPSLRTLLNTLFSDFQNKVVPRSVVNPDHLEPFNCKGLFTTTHAIKHRSQIKSEKLGVSNWHLMPIHPSKWISGIGCRIAIRNQVRLALARFRIRELFFMNYIYNPSTGGLA